jgi:hypothetical protein
MRGVMPHDTTTIAKKKKEQKKKEAAALENRKTNIYKIMDDVLREG